MSAVLDEVLHGVGALPSRGGHEVWQGVTQCDDLSTEYVEEEHCVIEEGETL